MSLGVLLFCCHLPDSPVKSHFDGGHKLCSVLYSKFPERSKKNHLEVFSQRK